MSLSVRRSASYFNAKQTLNGLDAARILKRMMPTVPLIMYSVFGDRFVEQQARLIGISEVVSKSDPFSVLLAKARNLLYPTAA
jgi:DNA-binding NarL/FixJ family response regulator